MTGGIMEKVRRLGTVLATGTEPSVEKLRATVDDFITAPLKGVYDAALNEDVPQHFTDLLNGLGAPPATNGGGRHASSH
jgi:hypothetical protein